KYSNKDVSCIYIGIDHVLSTLPLACRNVLPANRLEEKARWPGNESIDPLDSSACSISGLRDVASGCYEHIDLAESPIHECSQIRPRRRGT
ncbi:MAG: hypothetical protein ACE5Z5_11220, partial [Candidatus Bathyarchaeia archaeon]